LDTKKPVLGGNRLGLTQEIRDSDRDGMRDCGLLLHEDFPIVGRGSETRFDDDGWAMCSPQELRAPVTRRLRFQSSGAKAGDICSHIPVEGFRQPLPAGR
jgi:hypothetical protein